MNAMLAVVPAVDGSPDAVRGHLSVRKITPHVKIYIYIYMHIYLRSRTRYDGQIKSEISATKVEESEQSTRNGTKTSSNATPNETTSGHALLTRDAADEGTRPRPLEFAPDYKRTASAASWEFEIFRLVRWGYIT